MGVIKHLEGAERAERAFENARNTEAKRLARIAAQRWRWYGVHIGNFKTPARENDPRHMPPNFYYDQQDLITRRQKGKQWTWSASRPYFLFLNRFFS